MPMLTTHYHQLNLDLSHLDLDAIKWNSRGQALVKDATNLSDAGKLFMLPDDWVDGWKTWLWLAEKYQPNIAPAWHNHFAIVFYNPSSHSNFNLWLCYNITVRKHWIDKDFDLGTLQEGIYKMVDCNLAMVATGSLSHPAPIDSGPSSSHHNQNMCFCTWGLVSVAKDPYPHGSSIKANCFHPYKSAAISHTPMSSNPSGNPNKCICCSSTSHPPWACQATTCVITS
ncbi:Reverse transcriptase (RNA-dependent DNA polymerase) domain-containing protein [Rhizoctonia solani]|uniref:Reverse transcriptase (RNA-dependent DNA polymerase) domain-containing protein n=1 Tax=Rhizoctonia solani TaxID=456999 RepID=A0A8H8NVW8_9AGAM|nr:Reverse transcriptase (RNA-dependent DNA polymerase) domain-containing protein [Rhizoctonia solani]QRW19818.1 Reverse transcriptase (RNA-dependent DNA polymerase) domain-containing protein [Rhizoctonia solani]